jgi:uncharacterized membrane protein (GlpM family)
MMRFLVGGLVVSLFAVLADMLKPKSFAGLFGAAPSVALATLGMTMIADGKSYASIEARSMIAGALAFFAYASACALLLTKTRLRATAATSLALAVWFCGAFGLWLFLR